MFDYTVYHTIAWPGTYALYFFVIGISVTLFFFSALSWYREEFLPLRRSALYGSFALLVLGGVLLIADLSQPLRFLNILNPAYLKFDSPLAWGSLNLISFGLVSAVYLLMIYKGEDANGKRLAVLGALLGLGLPIYTGLRPHGPPAPPGLEYPADAGAVRLPVAALRVGGGLLHDPGQREAQGHDPQPHALVRRGDRGHAGLPARHHSLWRLRGRDHLPVHDHRADGPGLHRSGHAARSGRTPGLLLAPIGRQPIGMMAAGALLLVGGMALRYAILIGPQIVQTYY